MSSLSDQLDSFLLCQIWDSSLLALSHWFKIMQKIKRGRSKPRGLRCKAPHLVFLLQCVFNNTNTVSFIPANAAPLFSAIFSVTFKKNQKSLSLLLEYFSSSSPVWYSCTLPYGEDTFDKNSYNALFIQKSKHHRWNFLKLFPSFFDLPKEPKQLWCWLATAKWFIKVYLKWIVLYIEFPSCYESPSEHHLSTF